MSTQISRANRGPAAAAENRLAVLASARRLFAVRGYHVPLSAIARDAGVGQAVLYRHFPTRLDLAFAVFEENFVELEAIVVDPGPQTLQRLWRRLVDLTVETSAFVEMAVDARRTMPDYEGAGRLRALVEAALPPARAAEVVSADLTVDDVLVAHRMVYGVVLTTPDPARIPEGVEHAEHLLRRKLFF